MVTKKEGEYFIAEIKKSSKRMDNAIMQLKYYLYLLRAKSVKAKGLLKIPKEKKNIEVELSEEDIESIEDKIKKAWAVLLNESSPIKAGKQVCSKCAHYKFCWV